MWSNKRPTEVGRYWCYRNQIKNIITIWKFKDHEILFTNEKINGLSINVEDSFYNNMLWWSKKIEEPNDPKT